MGLFSESLFTAAAAAPARNRNNRQFGLYGPDDILTSLDSMLMSLLWLRVAVVLYGIAMICVWPASTAPNHAEAKWPWWRLLQPTLIGAVLFHFVSFVELLNANHRWEPVGVHELESLIGLMLAAIFCWAYFRYQAASVGVFILPIVFLLSLAPAIGPDFRTFLAPSQRNGLVFFHIALLLAAYSALIFSVVSNLLYLLEERRIKNKRVDGFLSWLPPLETMEKLAYRTLLFGFPCMTVGLLIGSLLAEASIGASYFLDPKVLLSFAMWIVYVGMLLARQFGGIRGRRAAYLSSFVFVLAISVWAANQFSSVHRYSAP